MNDHKSAATEYTLICVLEERVVDKLTLDQVMTRCRQPLSYSLLIQIYDTKLRHRHDQNELNAQND